jgi:hypothetical protein
MLVVLGAREREQLGVVPEALLDRADRIYDVAQRGALAAESLGALRIGPDGGILELALDFLEALALGVKVKDTPSARRRARSGLRRGN